MLFQQQFPFFALPEFSLSSDCPASLGFNSVNAFSQNQLVFSPNSKAIDDFVRNPIFNQMMNQSLSGPDLGVG